MRWAIVIPAYNEEGKIRSVLRSVFSLYPLAQVVVVDDGSTDKTAVVAQEAGAIVLRHELNRGQGAALATGTAYAVAAEAEVIIHFDADGQMEAGEIKQLAEIIERGEAEVVLGSRFLRANKIPWSKRRLILPLARLVNFLFTGLWLSDAHNGLRALSAEAARRINITQDHMAHNSEIVRQIRTLKLQFKEVPMTVRYYHYGQGLSGGLEIVKDLLLGILR